MVSLRNNLQFSLFKVLLLSALLTGVWTSRSFAVSSECKTYFLRTDDPALLGSYQHTFNTHVQFKASPRYHQSWNAQGFRYRDLLIELKKSGSPIIKVFEKLGFEVTDSKIVAPTLEAFITYYEKYLDELQIPEHHRIRPALAFRGTPNGPREGEVMLLAPSIEKFLENPTHWFPDYDLRLDPQKLSLNLAQGRFPLFANGFHDVFHFVMFALHPKYAHHLRSYNQNALNHDLNAAFVNRNVHFLEVLNLANPSRLSELLPQLSISQPKNGTTIEDFQSAISKLTREELKTKAEYWIENYNHFLTPYAAGMGEPLEKNIYSTQIKGLRESTILDGFYDGRAFYVDAAGTMPNAFFFDGLTHLPDYLKRVSEIFFQPNDKVFEYYKYKKVDQNQELDRILRLHIARMEYALWKSAIDINLDQWAKDTLIPELDLDSPTMKFIKDVFGENSVTYRYFTQPRKRDSP